MIDNQCHVQKFKSEKHNYVNFPVHLCSLAYMTARCWPNILKKFTKDLADMTNTLKKITREFVALLHERVVTSEDQQREVKRSNREEKVMASNTLVKRESERRGFGKLTSRGETTTSEANNIQDPVVRSTINFSFDYKSLIWAIFSWQSWLVFLGVVTTVKTPYI